MSDIKVHIYRPERMFGISVVVYRDDPVTGKRQILDAHPSGAQQWTDLEPNTDIQTPTFHLPNDVMDALMETWQTSSFSRKTIPREVELLQAHLLDAQGVRLNYQDMLTGLLGVISRQNP